MKKLIIVFTFVLISCSEAGIKIGHLSVYDIFEEGTEQELAIAAARGDREKIRALIENGANVNAMGDNGYTPLIWALLFNSKDGFTELLDSGANANIQIHNGESAISYSASIENPYFLTQVLKYGGNPNIINDKSSMEPTPIYNAISALRSVNVEILVENGANINTTDSSGTTPLLAAADLNQWHVVYSLLMHGADINESNRSNKNIVDRLENNGISRTSELYKWREKVVDYVRAQGIEVNPAIPYE